MIKSFADLIAYVSTFMTSSPAISSRLERGQAGPKSETPAWLKPGDVLEIEVPKSACCAIPW